MKPTNEDEHKIVCAIRNLQYFGFNETNIEYDGISTADLTEGKQITSIRWKQQQYIKN